MYLSQQGLGARANSQFGRDAALESIDAIKECLNSIKDVK